MSLRTEKVGSVIQKIVSEQILKLDLPFLTTVLRVEVDPDLKHARIWISVLPSGDANEKQIMDILKKNAYDLQGALYDELSMKNVPRISFRVDTSGDYISRINELIKKTHDEE